MRITRVSAWIVAVAIATLMPGCASQGRVQQLENEIARASAQVEELRKLHDATVRELARTVGELKELHSDAAKLARAEQERTQEMGRVEGRLADAEGTLRGLRGAIAELSREVGQLVSRASSPEPVRPGQSTRPGSPEQLYSIALANMRSGEHGQAVLDFLDLITEFPAHPLAADAQYWIGEAYYVQRDFRQALIEFQKLIQRGTGPRTADALLKVGLCYQALDEPFQAREAWARLIEEFPRSAAAQKARALLKARPAAARSR